MSFQEELEKLVLEIYFTGFQVGQYTQPSDETLEKRLNDSLTSIINLVDKELPSKRKDTSAEDLRAGTFRRGDDKYTSGYNQAIDDMRAKLKGVSNG